MANTTKEKWATVITDSTRNSGKPIQKGETIILPKKTTPVTTTFTNSQGGTSSWDKVTCKLGQEISAKQFSRRDSFKTSKPWLDGTETSDAQRLTKLGEWLDTHDVELKVAECFYGGRNNNLYITFE